MRLPKNKLKKNKSHLGKNVKADLKKEQRSAAEIAFAAKKAKEDKEMAVAEDKPELTEEEKFAAKQERKRLNAHRNKYKKRQGSMETGGKARVV